MSEMRSSAPGFVGLLILFLSSPVLILAEEAGVKAGVFERRPGPSAHSVIPANATFAIAVRNLKELKEKGDELVKAGGPVPGLPVVPSVAVNALLDFANIRPGIDMEAPFAFILMGKEFDDRNMILSIPFSDKAKMAENFDREAGDFADGKLVPTDARNPLMRIDTHMVLTGERFLVGPKDLLEEALASKSLEDELTPEQRQSLPDSDIVIHFSPTMVGESGLADDWDGLTKDLQEAADEGDDPRAKRLAKAMLPLAKEFRLAQIGVRIENGFALQGLLMFQPSDTVEKSLETLSGGPGASHLHHLPEGDVITGFSLTGNGGLNGSILRDILSLFADDFFNRENKGAWMDRQTIFGLFDEVWADMRGGRAAVYRNSDRTLGLYSALAIVETDDPTKLMEKIRDIALYVNHASDQLAEKKPEVDEEKVAQLIKDLANPDFRTRAQATNRLAMLGDAALPALRAAKESDDLEVRARVSALYRRLENLSKAREGDLIKGDLLAEIRPKFVFFPDAEKRLERRVDVAQLTIGIKKETEEALRQILGPEWKNIRLVQLDKQIVLLIGSDVGLLDKTIKNLAEDTVGLEGTDTFAGFKQLITPVRKAEFHFSTRHYAMRMNPGLTERFKVPEPEPGSPTVLSSAAVSIHKSAVRADLFLPPSEFAFYLRGAFGF